MYFGWLCMSCRQPATETLRAQSSIGHRATEARRNTGRGLGDSVAKMLRVSVAASIRNGGHLSRVEGLHESSRPFQIEFRVARLNAQEKAIAARQREPRYIEDRVIRHR